jgi:DNA repair exonuclease SbcCD ATPase subunit
MEDEVTSMSDLNTAKSLHDLLLNEQYKPSEASHDASLCPFCTAEVDGADADTTTPPGGGDMSNNTYTEEDLQAAVQAALAPVQAELSEIKTSQEQAEIDARFAELTEAHEATVAELQAQLDTATAEAEAEAAKHDELVAYLQDLASAEAAQAALEARRTEVAAAVADIFEEDHVKANLDRWAAMDDEAFQAFVADFSAVKADKADDTKPGKFTSTAMKAGLGDDNPDDVGSIRRSLHMQRRDIRTVGGSHN